MPCSAGSSSCSACLAQGSSCGWCDSTLTCIEGTRNGPSTSSECATWGYYYDWCPGDPADKCPPLATCADCLVNGRSQPLVDPTSCGWCTDASSVQRCVTGRISGPASGGPRCRSGGWLFSQFDPPSLCPALPSSPSRTPTPSTTRSAANTAPTPGGSSSGGGGGGGAPGSGAGSAAAADISPLVLAVALSMTLGLLLACACGVAAGWLLRERLQGGARWGAKPRPGSVAFAEDGGASASQPEVAQLNPVRPPPPAFRAGAL